MQHPLATSLAAAAALSATGATLAYAALYPQSQLFGPVLVAGRNPDEIALTYDDGPNPAATPQLLDILARHRVQATFFLIGRYARQLPQLTRQIAAAGHTIGNHSMTHPWLAWQSAARIRQELAGCNAALEDILGAPVTLFRPPHGARRPRVLHTARDLGLTTIQWNVITGDWAPVSADTIYTRLETGIARNRSRHRATNIVLHDGGESSLNQPRLATVEATARLLTAHPPGPTRYVTPLAWM